MISSMKQAQQLQLRNAILANGTGGGEPYSSHHGKVPSHKIVPGPCSSARALAIGCKPSALTYTTCACTYAHFVLWCMPILRSCACICMQVHAGFGVHMYRPKVSKTSLWRNTEQHWKIKIMRNETSRIPSLLFVSERKQNFGKMFSKNQEYA